MTDDRDVRRFLRTSFKTREGIVIATGFRTGAGERKEILGASTKLQIEPALKPADALIIASMLGMQFESVLSQLAKLVGLSLDDFMDLAAQLTARKMAEARIEPKR